MNIACLAILDNGNTMRHIARGLRDYCNLHATCFCQFPDTYLHIPDQTIEHWEGDLETDDFDFIITNDHTYHQYHTQLRDKPRLVKCNGTWAKLNAAWIHHDYIKYGTHYVTSPTDYSLAAALPFSIQTLPPLYDHRLLPVPAFNEEKITVGHAPTSPFKGTKTILKALQKYRKNGTIEIDIITNVPWEECIERKAACHIFIDQVTPNHKGAFGMNAIESLALGSIVLNEPLHPYVKHHYHRNPLYTFPTHLEKSINNIGEYIARPDKHNAKEWAQYHFDLYYQASKWRDWMEVVLHGVTPVTGS